MSNFNGKKLPVTIGPAEPPAEEISHEKVIDFQRQNNLSQNQTQDLQSFLNKNDAKVVKGLREELVKQNHILDDQHEIVKKFFLINGELVEKPMIVVKDASDFIKGILELRNHSSKDYYVRIHLDDGKKYLKLSVSLIPKTGWGRKDQKKGQNLGGVKKCFILAIVHKTPENHHNISILCESINIWGIKGWYIYKTKNLFF